MKQNLIINNITGGYDIILTCNNNKQLIQCYIIGDNFIYIFTSSKITLIKKFKNNIFDYL